MNISHNISIFEPKHLIDNLRPLSESGVVPLRASGRNGKGGSIPQKSPTSTSGPPNKNLCAKSMSEKYQYDWLLNETMRELKKFYKRAREGKDVFAAINFGNYITFSGIAKLCKQNGVSYEEVLEMEKLCRSVLFEAREVIRKCGCGCTAEELKEGIKKFPQKLAGPELSEVEKITERLDEISEKLDGVKIEEGRRDTEKSSRIDISETHIIARNA